MEESQLFRYPFKLMNHFFNLVGVDMTNFIKTVHWPRYAIHYIIFLSVLNFHFLLERYENTPIADEKNQEQSIIAICSKPEWKDYLVAHDLPYDFKRTLFHLSSQLSQDFKQAPGRIIVIISSIWKTNLHRHLRLGDWHLFGRTSDPLYHAREAPQRRI
jgi:hypothetical protein